MKVFRLDCHTCKIAFSPLVCTLPGELLYPDYDRPISAHLIEALRQFHHDHFGHDLEETSIDITGEVTRGEVTAAVLQ